MSNLIIWQKWIDPFGEDDISDIEEAESKYVEDEYDSYDNENGKKSKPNIAKAMKVIATPMGIIPLNENTASGKIFNFWVGHTNFDITQAVCRIIEESHGVESLDIFTRYRFRISIGKAFNDSQVMTSIQNSVYNYLDSINYDIK